MSWGEIYKRTPFGKLNNPNGFGEAYKDIKPDDNTEENGSTENSKKWSVYHSETGNNSN